MISSSELVSCPEHKTSGTGETLDVHDDVFIEIERLKEGVQKKFANLSQERPTSKKCGKKKRFNMRSHSRRAKAEKVLKEEKSLLLKKTAVI